MLKDCESVSQSVSQSVSEIIKYRAAALQLKIQRRNILLFNPQAICLAGLCNYLSPYNELWLTACGHSVKSLEIQNTAVTEGPIHTVSVPHLQTN